MPDPYQMPPMGKGPGGSNDVSGLINDARVRFQRGEITEKQFTDFLDYYAPKAPAVTPPTRIGNKSY